MSENQRNMGTSQKFFIMWSSPFTIYTRTSRFFKFFRKLFLRFSQELFLSLSIPGQASFLSFLHRKIPDIFLGYRGLGSNTSRWGGSSDMTRIFSASTSSMEVSITSRWGGSSDRKVSRRRHIQLVSITSRWGGSSDCKPTSLHGYTANWDLNFKKTFNLLHFYHPLYYDFTT